VYENRLTRLERSLDEFNGGLKKARQILRGLGAVVALEEHVRDLVLLPQG
jgi:hypothetical protein